MTGAFWGRGVVEVQLIVAGRWEAGCGREVLAGTTEACRRGSWLVADVGERLAGRVGAGSMTTRGRKASWAAVAFG